MAFGPAKRLLEATVPQAAQPARPVDILTVATQRHVGIDVAAQQGLAGEGLAAESPPGQRGIALEEKAERPGDEFPVAITRLAHRRSLRVAWPDRRLAKNACPAAFS